MVCALNAADSLCASPFSRSTIAMRVSKSGRVCAFWSKAWERRRTKTDKTFANFLYGTKAGHWPFRIQQKHAGKSVVAMNGITAADREAAKELRVTLADNSGFWHRIDDDGPLCQALARHRIEAEQRLSAKLAQFLIAPSSPTPPGIRHDKMSILTQIHKGQEKPLEA